MSARADNATYLRDLRAKAAARGLCYVCRKRFPRPGVRTCDDCMARSALAVPSKAALEKQRERVRRASATRYAERVAAGLCPGCGRRRPEDGRAQCSICLDYQAAKQLERNRTVGHQPTTKRCRVCGGVGHNRLRHERPGVLP